MYRIYLIFLSILFISIGVKAQNLDTLKALEHVRILSSDSLEGRKIGTEGGKLAREYIVDQYKQIGLAAYFPDYVQNFPYVQGADTLTGTNIVGFIEGEYDAVIVITAHYDHVGKKDTIVYNGADDNASGIGGLLELARYFSQNKPMHTLLFCAFDGEEYGMKGSRAFMSSSAVNPMEYKLNINMDMIGRSETGVLYVVGTAKFPYYLSYLPLGKNGDYELKTGHDGKDGEADWTYSSDHSIFLKNDIPFLYFGVDDHEDYHKPTDTVDKILPSFYGFTLNTILNSLLKIDQSLTQENDQE